MSLNKPEGVAAILYWTQEILLSWTTVTLYGGQGHLNWYQTDAYDHTKVERF